MSQSLNTTAKATGRIVGLIGSIAMVALGVALVLYSSDIAGGSLLGVEGQSIIWVAVAGSGFAIGSIGVLMILFWTQTASRRRKRARH